jgi:beta-lactamase regulating signal transducer with metallopeptidase domain
MNALLQSLNAFSAAGLTAVLNTLWPALAVTAAIWLALRSMPRMNAATRHAVWWAVLALIVLLPLATLLQRPVSPASFSARTENRIPAPALSSPSAVKPLHVTGADASAALLTSAPLQQFSSPAVVARRIRVPIEFHPGNWPSRLLFLWIAVSCILLRRIVRSYWHLRGLRNRARPASAELVLRFAQRLRDSRAARATQLLVSDEVISPLAVGFLHPVVILPGFLLEQIAGPELDYALLHELAHVARHDDWTNLMGRLAFAAFVLHPVAAWILRRIEREREIACDDWVVAATGSAAQYAKTLARLFEFCRTRRRELLATGMAHASSNLGERIEILVRPRSHFSARASLARVSFCVAACLVLLSFAVRIPGWIAFAKNSSVAVAYVQAVPQPQISPRPVAVAAPLSPVNRAESSAVPPVSTDQDKTIPLRRWCGSP